MKHGLFLKLGDILLFAVIIISALILFLLPFSADKASSAQIVLTNTDEVRTVSLDDDADYEIYSAGVSLTVSVRDGEIFVSKSDCKDKICRNTHPISRSGQTIVCVPAGVLIRVLGEGGAVDGVSG